MNDYQDSPIWRRSLAACEHDLMEKPRERLRQSFVQFRNKVDLLVPLITKDIPHITVHNISHLDALWEIASIIAGDDYPLNPAEAFVLGGGILLHDAAMCLAAYPGGMQDLRKTPQWRDSVALLLSARGKTPMPQELAFPPEEIACQALQETLRLLHAQKARDLATQNWTNPEDKEIFYLLEDSDLRHHYGPIIGQIAESHWWDVSKLENLCPKKLTVAAGLPTDWTVDPVKVACLLRAADAAHIDQRRAPRFLAVLLKPQGLSAAHWNFQAKLGKPVREGDALLYTSGQPFSVQEYESWWLAFQTLDMIDRELRQVDILLEQTQRHRFDARRVMGVESTEHAKQYLPTSNWTPVDTRLRISNVARVAEMVGGKRLYGDNPSAALRELTQNAADAVRARRKLECLEETWGEIEVKLEKQGNDYWLHVLDKGIGMSPRVMTEALLDFGNSFWRSPLVREEFPGLLGDGMNATGCFGIGFFSVFMLGKEVHVLSKRFDGRLDETHVLEFRDGLNTPPLLRVAEPEERRFVRDGGTRVSIRLATTLFSANSKGIRVVFCRVYGRDGISKFDYISDELNTLTDLVSWICQSLDVTVYTVEDGPRQKSIEANDWLMLTGAELEKRIRIGHNKLTSNIRPLVAKSGEILGRAWIDPSESSLDGGSIVVGGFYVESLPHLLGFWLAEKTLDIARDKAIPVVPFDVLQSWASTQADLIERAEISLEDKLICARVVLACGGVPGRLPVCLYREKWYSKKRQALDGDQFKQCINNINEIWLQPCIDMEDYRQAVYFENDFTVTEYPMRFMAVAEVLYFGRLGSSWPYSLSDYPVDHPNTPFRWLHKLVKEAWGAFEIEHDVTKVIGKIEKRKEEITCQVDILRRG